MALDEALAIFPDSALKGLVELLDGIVTETSPRDKWRAYEIVRAIAFADGVYSDEEIQILAACAAHFGVSSDDAGTSAVRFHNFSETNPQRVPFDGAAKERLIAALNMQLAKERLPSLRRDSGPLIELARNLPVGQISPAFFHYAASHLARLLSKKGPTTRAVTEELLGIYQTHLGLTQASMGNYKRLLL